MPTTTTLPLAVTARRTRAADLRRTAGENQPPVAIAYRRRAAELELEATALAARLGYEETISLAA